MKLQLTPLMQQYTQIKAEHPDTLLLFHVGDFYETFDEDAIKCSQALNIVLTQRVHGTSRQTKLAGFPCHTLNSYLPKLIRAGFRVAICDQLEDSKNTRNLIKRGITSIVTPGLSLDDQVVDSTMNNFLAALHLDIDIAGLALLDISTGEFLTSEGSLSYIYQLIRRFSPSEVLYEKKKKNAFEDFLGKDYYSYAMDDWIFQYNTAYEKLIQHFQTNSLKGLGLESYKHSIIASGAILIYLENTHNYKISHLSSISRIDEIDHVWMDDFTLRSLEILHPNYSNGLSLFDILNHTCTAMGSRLLKRWIMLPLKKLSLIKKRHDLLESLRISSDISIEIGKHLRFISDIERLISKLSTEKISPREIMYLNRSLEMVCTIKKILSSSQKTDLKNFSDHFPDYTSLYEYINNSLHPDPPHKIETGHVIATGFSKKLDELRILITSRKKFLEVVEQREKEKNNIPNIKISSNNIFGYFIEIRNIHKDKVPDHWIRKQTLTNTERYVTEELKNYEFFILEAEEQILLLEIELFQKLLSKVSEHIDSLKKGAKLLAHLDVILSFVKNAQDHQYIRPELDDSKNIIIDQGRHPVIEQTLSIGTNYIPNDLSLQPESSQILMITGPNMSGKSAFLRQTALIILMAQIGSYVPAKCIKMGLVDKIFSRVGASDNLSLGESTFMVEMNETACILNNLSERSLILLDEIGRGTSTYDGMAIAWSVVEYLHEHAMRPKTLCATHYHELHNMNFPFSRIKNFHFSVKELEEKIFFLYKIFPGSISRSFGIHVAKMAGIPLKIIQRATDLLKQVENLHLFEKFENQSTKYTPMHPKIKLFHLSDPLLEKLRDELIKLDINLLTPLNALIKLSDIKNIFTESFEK